MKHWAKMGSRYRYLRIKHYALTCPKSTIKTPAHIVKSVQSLQGRHKNGVIKLFAKIVNEGVSTFGKVGFIFLNEIFFKK